MPGPISNASSFNLNQSRGTLPNVSSAVVRFFQPLKFVKITKTTKRAKLIEVREEVATMGVIQPLNSQQLMVKPEGQRAWKWNWIHALPTLVLNNDDVVTLADAPAGGTSYRVMGKTDFSAYGYVAYEVVQDYKAAP